MTNPFRTKWSAALAFFGILVALWIVKRANSQALVQPPAGAVNLLVNSDFRKVTAGLPDYWYFDGGLHSKGTVRLAAESLCLDPNSRNTDGNKPFALAQMIYPEPFLGHRLLLQASMNVSSGGSAYVHLFALSRGKPIAHASISQASGSGVVSQQDSLTVPAETDQLFFVLSTGSTKGSACFTNPGIYVMDPDAPTAPMPTASAARTPRARTLPALAVSSSPAAAAAAPVRPAAQASSGPNIIQNPHFRVSSGSVPDSWLLDNALAPKGSVRVEPDGGPGRQAALCLAPNSRNSDKSKPFGLAQIIPAAPYRNKKLEVRAALKVTQGGTAFLHLFAIANGRPVGEVTFNQSTASGDFVSQDNALGVPGNAENLLFAVTTNSTTGRACFADLYVGEGGGGGGSNNPPPANLAAASGATIRVNAAKVLRNIPAGLYGANVEWVRNGNGIWDSSRNQLRPEIVSRMRDAGVSVIRYPGGGLADHFHWRDSVGPMVSRPVRPHVLDPESSKLVFGTGEFIDLCRALGAEPLITVNITEGDAKEAADWVAYCNRADNAERTRNGSPAPYNVKYWEIGNEQYINNRTPGMPNSYLRPDEYARRFQEFSAAMKAVDPSIVIGAIGGANFAAYHLLNDEDWDARLFSAEAGKFDFLSIHNGYAPLVGTTPGLHFDDVYKAMLAFPAQVEQNIARISGDMDARGATMRQTGIAVTEWGPLFAAEINSPWAGHTKTLGSALYVAGLFNVFLRSPRVQMATYLKVTENNYMGWLYPNGEPKPSFEVLQLYHQHMGTRLTDTAVNSPGFSSPGLGSVAAASNTPYLDAVSSLDNSGSRLTIVAVNRDFDRPWSTSIQIDGFSPASNGKAWQITAPSLDENNGEDLDPRLPWAPQQGAPGGGHYKAGHPGNVVPTERVVTGLSTSFNYTFPPKSVTVLEMVAR